MLNKFKTISRRADHFYMNKCAAASAVLVSLPFLSTMTSFASGISNIATKDTNTNLKIKWPWESFLYALADQLTGPLPLILGALGIAAAAIGMFLGNHGAGMQKMLVLIFAVSICLFAPSFVTYLKDGVGGATIFGM